MTVKSVEQIANDLFAVGFDMCQFDDIITVLTSADDLYFNGGESFLTDEQYDTLKQYVSHTNPLHPCVLGVGSEVRGGKVQLPFPMGSLTQAYQGDIETWVAKYSLENQNFLVTDKLDGVSVLIVYDDKGALQIAYSRGDGTFGADVTRHIWMIPDVPKNVAGPMVVRAEVIMNEVNFQKARKFKSRNGQPYKNARNMIAGIMNASTNPDKVYQFVYVVAYEVIIPTKLNKSAQFTLLTQNNFEIVKHAIFLGKDLNDDTLTAHLNTQRNFSGYAIDGVVIEVNDAKIRAKINPTKDTLNPEYARKYKVADAANLAIATVTEVEWNISKDGYLKPRVCVEPIELVGVTIQHATGFNAAFIRDNKIGPGAKVKITRSGDVIPFLIGVVKPAKQGQMPVEDVEWTSTGVDLVLKHVQSNTTVQFEQLNDFFASIDAPHLREGNLKAIFDAGITTPEDVINMTESEMCGIVGKAIGKKAFQGLREKLTNIPIYMLMGAHTSFGRGIGQRKMKKLFEAFEGDISKCTSIVNLLTVEGFEHKSATKVANGYPVFMKFFKQIEKFVTVAPFEKKKQGGLSGQIFVFTGFRSKELEQTIEQQGGKISTSVSSKTTFVVADDPSSTSGKAGKARELGIKILSVDQLNAML